MVRAITAAESLVVRHPVLRPGRPMEDAVFACDDDESTQHYGAFDDEDVLIGVVTIHPADFEEGSAAGMMVATVKAPASWQLRGMATVPSVRGRGYGAALVRHVHHCVRAAGGELFWCNARVVAVPFYERLGWEVVGEPFDIPTVGPHFRMIRRL